MSEDKRAKRYEVAFPDLANIYLEDSWVLDVHVSLSTLIFTLDAVLTPNHSAYRPPEPGQAHCYRRATLRLESDSAIHFRPSQTPAAVDAHGESDHGNIDTFLPSVLGTTTWELTGEWGEALVRNPRARIELPSDR